MQGQIRNATRLIATALRAAHACAEGDSWAVLPVSLRLDSEGVGKSLASAAIKTSWRGSARVGRNEAHEVAPVTISAARIP